jgi:hypothetical protein
MQEERRAQEGRLREQVDTRSEIAACLDYRRVKAAAEELQRQLDQLAASTGQVRGVWCRCCWAGGVSVVPALDI